MSEAVKKIVTPISIEYTITPGAAPTKFLRGIKEGRLLGQRCPKCSKVYLPPRGSCTVCAVPTVEEVEVSDQGTVTTFCVVNIPFYGQVQEIPYVCAAVVLDGADLPCFGVVQEIAVEEVRMGLRVQAVWVAPEERGYTLENIKYFKPSGQADAPFESYREHL